MRQRIGREVFGFFAAFFVLIHVILAALGFLMLFSLAPDALVHIGRAFEGDTLLPRDMPTALVLVPVAMSLMLLPVLPGLVMRLKDVNWPLRLAFLPYFTVVYVWVAVALGTHLSPWVLLGLEGTAWALVGVLAFMPGTPGPNRFGPPPGSDTDGPG